MRGLSRNRTTCMHMTMHHSLPQWMPTVMVMALFALLMLPLSVRALGKEASEDTSSPALEAQATLPPTPDSIWAEGEVGCVELQWLLPSEDDEPSNDGSGIVDYFNIYRDRRLVAQVERSAVSVTVNWQDQGDRSYGWSICLPVPDAEVEYEWYVTAVSPSGKEGQPSESVWAGSKRGGMPIVSHKAWFSDSYQDEATGQAKPCILVRVDTDGYGASLSYLEIWRAEGTSAPDTSGEPYMRVTKNHVISGINQHDVEDYDVKANKTYTYTVCGLDADGFQTEPYTFTIKAVDASDYESIFFGTPEATYKTENGKTPTLTFPAYTWEDIGYPASYKVYRNNKLFKTVVGDDRMQTVTDTPTTDGVYVYRVDQEVAGITTKGREFTFRRDTTPVDPSTFEKAPGAPTLTGRVTASNSSGTIGIVALDWSLSSEGGKPEGFHIYRKDAGAFVEGTRYKDSWSPSLVWGLNRYLTIRSSSVRSFVDNGKPYNNDEKQGYLTELYWDDKSAPHEYYVTAYNQYGESAPSNAVTFPYAGGVVPGSQDTAAPGAPTIKSVWMDWEDGSGNYANMQSGTFDDDVRGSIRVTFEEPADGANVDSYEVQFEEASGGGEPHDYDGDGMIDDTSWSTEDIPRWVFVRYPSLLSGVAEETDSEAYLPGHRVGYGYYGTTFTVTVKAKNSKGETASQPMQVVVRSIPLIQVYGGNAHALVRWSELFHDTETTVTSWELYRTPEHGLPKLVGTFDASVHEHDDTTAQNGWTYTYYVVAKCIDGIDRRSVDFETSVAGSREAPATPTDLTATIINGEVVLSWTQPTTGGMPESYQCDLIAPGEEWPADNEYHYTLVDGASTGTTVDVREDWYGLDLRMRIYAINEDGRSAASNVVTFKITDADIEKRAKSVPDLVWIDGTAGDGYCKLTWDASTNADYPPATYYVLTRSRAGEYDERFTIPAKGTGAQSYEYVDRAVENGVAYRYEVHAWNSAGESFNWNYNYLVLRPQGRSHDLEVAEKMAELIEALPEPDDVTLKDADAIGFAQQTWEELTSNQQRLVKTKLQQKLADDVQALEDLQKLEKYRELVEPVQALIDALPDAADVSLADEQQITKAREAYNALAPADAKRLVKRVSRLTDAEAALQACKDQAAAEAVAAQIDALPDADVITLDDKPAVVAARAALDALADEQRSYVPEASTTRLTQIEKAIRRLENVAPINDNKWSRLSGKTRYDTMATIVEHAFTSSEGAVVATGGNYPDALAASALAGSLDAPVILTDSNELSPQASTQLEQLGVKHVYIMGGTGAVSDKTVSQIQELNGGIDTTRVAGSNRLDTSIAGMRLVSGQSDTVIIATGNNFADTLSIGPWSYLTRSPIVLAGSDGTLSDAEVEAIRDAGYSKYLIVGGTGAVSDIVDSQLEGLEKVGRLAGKNRYATSSQIAQFELAWGMEATYPVVGTGVNFPDALAGAALCGTRNSVMVLVQEESSEGIAVLEGEAAHISHGYVLGGAGVVSDELAGAIAARTGMSFDK